MTGLATRFALCTLTCIVASASVVVLHLDDAGAADDCLAAPNKQSPTNRHWFYRVDRSTKRHCWYLGERGSHTARSTSSKRAALFARLRRENAQDHHADDARAELTQKRVEDTLRADDALLTTSTDRRRLVAARSTQDLPDVATGQEQQSLIAARWPNSASVLLPPSGLTNVSLASALATPDSNILIPTDPEPAASPPATDKIDKADAQPASRADSRAGGRANSVYSLFWALCGTLIIVVCAGGATYFIIVSQERPHERWLPQRFDVETMTWWLDQAADVTTRFSRPARRASAQRHDEPERRSAA